MSNLMMKSKRTLAFLLAALTVFQTPVTAIAENEETGEEFLFLEEEEYYPLGGAVTASDVHRDGTYTEDVYWILDGSELLITTQEPAVSTDSGYTADGRLDVRERYQYGELPWAEYTGEIESVTVGGTDDIVVPYYTAEWFSGLENLMSVDLAGIDTSGTVDMREMFRGCVLLESLDLSAMDTSKAVSMAGMFRDCESLNCLELDNFSTSAVTDFSRMFMNCSCLTDLDISMFDLRNGITITYMFSGCTQLVTLDIGEFRCDSATNSSYVFSGCTSLASLDLTDAGTAAAVSMEGMFEGCAALTELDLTAFVTKKVKYMAGMFRGCSSLETVDVSSFSTPVLRSAQEMFKDCASLKAIDLSGFDTDCLTDLSGMFSGCTSLTGVTMNKVVNSYEHKDLHEMFRGCASLTDMKLLNETENSPEENVIVIDCSTVDDMSGMLMGCSGLETLAIYFNMLGSKDLTDMLAGCTALTSFEKGPNCSMWGKAGTDGVNLPNPSPEYITGADGYWYVSGSSGEKRYVSGLLPDQEDAAVYRAVYGAVTYDPNGYDTDPVTEYLNFEDSQYTVKGNPFGIGKTLLSWNTAPDGTGTKFAVNATVNPAATGLLNATLYAIWEDTPGATVTIDWKNHDGTLLKSDEVQVGMMPVYKGPAPERAPEGSTIYIFKGWSPVVEIATENREYYADYEVRTQGKVSITFDADNGTAPKVVETEYGTVPEYGGTPEKTDPEGVYNYTFDHWEPELTKAVADTSYTAVYVKTNKKALYWSLENGVLTISSRMQTGKAVSGNFLKDRVFTETSPAPWYGMRSRITAVSVGSPSDAVKPESLSCWFKDLEYAESFSLTGLDASGAEDVSRMFENCRRLTSLDLSGLSTGNVKNFSCMLKDCPVLTAVNLTGLDTRSAADMSGMFDGAIRIDNLDLSGFVTTGVTDFSNMFRNCRYMETLDISGLRTDSALTMENMFSGCRSLETLDVSKFNTSSATNLNGMFKNTARVRSLDLSGFAVDPAKTTTKEMLSGMPYLSELKTGPKGDFTGASLATPDGAILEGAHGRWISNTDDTGYKPEELPVDKADTYRVVYAKVIYDPNGGTGSRRTDYMKSSAAYYGVKGAIYTAPAGKYFAGWSLNPLATSADYKGGQTLTKKRADAELKDTKTPKVLYAVWKEAETVMVQVIWRDADGNVLRTDSVPAGSTPSYGDTPPGKASDDEFSYTFREWSPEIGPVFKNTEYSPLYDSTRRSYKVTWVNDDDDETVLYGPIMVEYGKVATCSIASPSKPADTRYTYEFKGWSPESGPIRKDTVYKAAYLRKEIPTEKKYRVVWKNYDGVTVLQEQQVAENTEPTYTGPTPVQTPSDTYTYNFAGWSPKIGKITKDTTYVAKFSRTIRSYDVIYNGNGHGETVTRRVYVGSLLDPPADPEEENYTFTGWYTTADCVEKVDFETYLMPAHAVTLYAGWSKKSTGGGGGGGSVRSITVNQNLGGSTYSPNWKQNAAGKWYITDNQGSILHSCWLCDDAVAVNRCDVWYLLNEDGTMVDAGLVQDNTGNYYSLEMEHNGYYGRLRTQNGYYDGIWLEFEHEHNGNYGAIKNKAGIEALKAKYGVTRFNIGNESCRYTSAL